MLLVKELLILKLLAVIFYEDSLVFSFETVLKSECLTAVNRAVKIVI